MSKDLTALRRAVVEECAKVAENISVERGPHDFVEDHIADAIRRMK
jgi:hypothetical protein